ncbi:MAG: hypothetical protein WCP21_12970, partial [Armatimonadota bacterium]
ALLLTITSVVISIVSWPPTAAWSFGTFYACTVSEPISVLCTAIGNLMIIGCIEKQPRTFIMSHQTGQQIVRLNAGFWVSVPIVLAYGLPVVVLPAWVEQWTMRTASTGDMLVSVCLGAAGAFAADILIWGWCGRRRFLPRTGHPTVNSLMHSEGYRRSLVGMWKPVSPTGS